MSYSKDPAADAMRYERMMEEEAEAKYGHTQCNLCGGKMQVSYERVYPMSPGGPHISIRLLACENGYLSNVTGTLPDTRDHDLYLQRIENFPAGPISFTPLILEGNRVKEDGVPVFGTAQPGKATRVLGEKDIEDQAVLCYVAHGTAYFTTRKLSEQWGDDWNDTPYEHNAGEPYTSDHNDAEQWDIIEVKYEGPFETPAEMAAHSSSVSVEMINKGVKPWLIPVNWPVCEPSVIMAGTCLREFKRIIKTAGGSIWVMEP